MLTATQKQAFEENGFLVLERVLSGDFLREVQDAAHEIIATDPDPPLRVWHERALFRRAAFRRVLNVSQLIEAEESLLGPDVQLLAIDLLRTRAHAGAIGWHRDVNFVCNKTLSINTGIYLQDMTDEVGPLRVVPRSHRWEEFPQGNGPFEGEIAVPVQAGDAVLFDACLWHTGSPNRSDKPRLGLFAFFGKYFIKRMDNHFTQPLPAALLHSQEPLQRQLLGLGLRHGVPSYHGDDESYNRRGEAGIDFANV